MKQGMDSMLGAKKGLCLFCQTVWEKHKRKTIQETTAVHKLLPDLITAPSWLLEQQYLWSPTCFQIP